MYKENIHAFERYAENTYVVFDIGWRCKDDSDNKRYDSDGQEQVEDHLGALPLHNWARSVTTSKAVILSIKFMLGIIVATMATERILFIYFYSSIQKNCNCPRNRIHKDCSSKTPRRQGWIWMSWHQTLPLLQLQSCTAAVSSVLAQNWRSPILHFHNISSKITPDGAWTQNLLIITLILYQLS